MNECTQNNTHSFLSFQLKSVWKLGQKLLEFYNARKSNVCPLWCTCLIDGHTFNIALQIDLSKCPNTRTSSNCRKHTGYARKLMKASSMKHALSTMSRVLMLERSRLNAIICASKWLLNPWTTTVVVSEGMRPHRRQLTPRP
jgi:hypothetical protein